jgi:sec-independent protein translocase protein TatC
MSEPEEFADEEGGARKSFWEHVQDLRTALIRSAVALGIALLVCLLLDKQLVSILEFPIRRMHMFEPDHPTVVLEVGDTKLGPFAVTKDSFPGLPPGKNPHVVFRLGAMQVGNQQVATLQLDPTATAAPIPLEVQLHNYSPSEAFYVAFHVALYAAVVVSSPFWIFYLGGFIIPALKAKERKVIGSWVGWGVVLALVGVLLTYFFLLPVALRAAVKYSELLGFDASQWRSDEYISFTCKFILGMGLGFQFPLVVLLLVKMGVLTHKQLSHYRRHVIVLSLILGAVLTTPEPITQIAMAVPLYILYEACVWIAWYWDRQKAKRGEYVEI